MINENYFPILPEIYTKSVSRKRLPAPYAGGFSRFAYYLQNEHGIVDLKKMQISHVKMFIEFLRNKGYAETTLRNYVTAIRQTHKTFPKYFSEKIAEMPTHNELGLK